MHKMLNVNDYFQVAMRSGKLHSECGGPGLAAARPNRPFGDVAAKGSNEAVSGRSDPAQLHAFWGIDVTCGELSPFRKTQAQAVGRVKKKTQLPRASRSVIINSAFSVRSGHFLCKN